MSDAATGNVTSPRAWVERLELLGTAVRGQLIAARNAGSDLATAVAQEGGDTIFAVDRHVEPVIEEHVERWPDACKPLLLIAEGMGEDGRRRYDTGTRGRGDAGKDRFRVIIDPIDGTRNIMYDKRSAWFIAAVTPNNGESTTLADSIASVMVELPTSKGGWADSFTAVKGEPTVGKRVSLQITNSKSPITNLSIRPSQSPTLKNGFGQVANFFPGTKVLASELMEAIVKATLGDVAPGSASVFDDQYITTAGQMIEIMLGHDRFCADLRPLFYRVLEKQTGVNVRGLECHPYDVAGLLAATQAGVIVTDGFGRPIAAPLDVHTGVHWIGYANETLRRKIEPVIVEWFQERGVGN